MMLHCFTQLSEQQLSDLQSLCTTCKIKDKYVIATYPHLLDKPRPIPCNILYYNKRELIAFLRPFFFYENTCEIAMMVAPKYRKRGIARKMLQTILPYLHNVNTLSFSVPAGQYTSWLTEMDLHYMSSQYEMQYDLKKYNNSLCSRDPDIRPAVAEDIPLLCVMHRACFPEPNAHLEPYFYSLLTEPDYQIFVLEHDGVLCGKAHLRRQNNDLFLADLAVTPHIQNQGYGTRLIQHCLHHAYTQQRSTMILDVETKNQQAVSLYHRLGFEITNSHDYWKTTPGKEEFGLTAFLHGH